MNLRLLIIHWPCLDFPTISEITPFAATWKDLELIIVSEVSQIEKDIPCDIIYMWNVKKKKDTN